MLKVSFKEVMLEIIRRWHSYNKSKDYKNINNCIYNNTYNIFIFFNKGFFTIQRK